MHDWQQTDRQTTDDVIAYNPIPLRVAGLNKDIS